jgi:hypothetical protein
LLTTEHQIIGQSNTLFTSRFIVDITLAIAMHRFVALALLMLYSTLSVAGVCESVAPEEFAVFFSKFTDDKQFSIGRTIFPLRALKWEFGIDASGKDESAPVRSRIPKEKYANAPSLSAYMRENGLTAKIKNVTSRSAVVEVFKDGTDWLTTRHFVRKGNCWFLYEYQDHSL